jgi:cyclophilin family peptidyl-prolyl cis-trans isomerase
MKLNAITSLGRLILPVVLAAFGQQGTAQTAVKEKAGEKPVEVVMTTSKGVIEIVLDSEKAPITVKNFLTYIDKKFYDSTIFHRVIPNFMAQGGGMTRDMKEKSTDAPIKNEGLNGLLNARGTLAMARTSDPDSATAQFFINVVDNKFLDGSKERPGYAVFGKVTKGMDVVDAMVAVKTGDKGMHQNVPVEPIIIESVRRKK